MKIYHDCLILKNAFHNYESISWHIPIQGKYVWGISFYGFMQRNVIYEFMRQ